MPYSEKLNKIISNALGVPLKDVSWRARRLRDVGMLSSGGRGRSAPAPTPMDAAKIILAVTATLPGNAADAPRVVVEFDEKKPALIEFASGELWSRDALIDELVTRGVSEDMFDQGPGSFVGLVASFLVGIGRDDPTLINLERVGFTRGEGYLVGWYETRANNAAHPSRTHLAPSKLALDMVHHAREHGMITEASVSAVALLLIARKATLLEEEQDSDSEGPER